MNFGSGTGNDEQPHGVDCRNRGTALAKTPSKVRLYTDSQYLQKGINEWMPKWLAKNWRGTNGPVANQELWQEL